MTRFIVIRIAPQSFLRIENPNIMFALEHLNMHLMSYMHKKCGFILGMCGTVSFVGFLIGGILVHFSRRLLEEGHINNSVEDFIFSVPKKSTVSRLLAQTTIRAGCSCDTMIPPRDTIDLSMGSIVNKATLMTEITKPCNSPNHGVRI